MATVIAYYRPLIKPPVVMLFFWGLGEMSLMKEAQEDLLERQRDVVVAFAGSIKACKGIIVSNDETLKHPPKKNILA